MPTVEQAVAARPEEVWGEWVAAPPERAVALAEVLEEAPVGMLEEAPVGVLALVVAAATLSAVPAKFVCLLVWRATAAVKALSVCGGAAATAIAHRTNIASWAWCVLTDRVRPAFAKTSWGQTVVRSVPFLSQRAARCGTAASMKKRALRGAASRAPFLVLLPAESANKWLREESTLKRAASALRCVCLPVRLALQT